MSEVDDLGLLASVVGARIGRLGVLASATGTRLARTPSVPVRGPTGQSPLRSQRLINHSKQLSLISRH